MIGTRSEPGKKKDKALNKVISKLSALAIPFDPEAKEHSVESKEHVPPPAFSFFIDTQRNIHNKIIVITCFLVEEAEVKDTWLPTYLNYLKGKPDLTLQDLDKVYHASCLIKAAVIESPDISSDSKKFALQSLLFIVFQTLFMANRAGEETKKIFLNTLPAMPAFVKSREEVLLLLRDRTEDLSMEKQVLQKFFQDVNEEVLKRIDSMTSLVGVKKR